MIYWQKKTADTLKYLRLYKKNCTKIYLAQQACSSWQQEASQEASQLQLSSVHVQLVQVHSVPQQHPELVK